MMKMSYLFLNAFLMRLLLVCSVFKIEDRLVKVYGGRFGRFIFWVYFRVVCLELN